MADQLSAAKKARAFVTGRFELQLDGAKPTVGVLHSVDGGQFKSEPIGEKVGGENLVTRYPGRQKFEDITIQCGTSMGPQFWDWIRDSIKNKPSRRNGDIIALDFDGCQRSRRRFMDALISEVQFPALDARSKEPKRLTIKIAPEQLKYFPETGGTSKSPGDISAKAQKQQTPENFVMRIDGMSEEATRRINKIDAFSVKQTIIDNPTGGMLFARREAGRVEFPTLTIYVVESYVQPFMDWWEEFVGKGNHTHKNERNGSITYLDGTLRKEMGGISLQGLGITGITFDKHDGHGEGIRNAKVDLYVESLDFTFKG
jgi:phage tail-like protein